MKQGISVQKSDMNEPSFLPDGYTRHGNINRVTGDHGPLGFEYRPLLYEERMALAKARMDKPAKEVCAITRAMLVKQLVSWDLSHKGNALPIEDKVLRRLAPNLFDKLDSILCGYAVSDLADDPTPQEQDEYIRSLEVSESERQEADSKNSLTG
jgi:hypothetical protein